MDLTGYLEGIDSGDWPEEAENEYERVDILGKGSFGMVWMARLKNLPEDVEDEYVAIKNIKIKDEKSRVYAEREISILEEMNHPNIIRLIRAYPVFGSARLVVMQLARGPNLHQLVVKRGALGLPLARLASRHLIAAVSYLHGRAVIHRDVKPSNCILACNEIGPTESYDWFGDDLIWSNSAEAEEAVKRGRWKLMLVDFGFARALEQEEITAQAKKLRNSIVFEKGTKPPITTTNISKIHESDDDYDEDDEEMLAKLAEKVALSMRGKSFKATNVLEDEVMGTGHGRRRESGISMPIPEPGNGVVSKRASTTRHNVRSMSALGTKAYAAPEIRKKLRHKNDADLEKANAAMTECVADYGMIVDAYSVGWTMRVAITGVPPNFTISEYLRERDAVCLENEYEELPSFCCCIASAMPKPILIRDPADIPYDATLLIASMTERKPEDRMTVREAQNHPYIIGTDGDRYSLPQGDIPSQHGDPVVPLKCAKKLSELTVEYHMN